MFKAKLRRFNCCASGTTRRSEENRDGDTESGKVGCVAWGAAVEANVFKVWWNCSLYDETRLQKDVPASSPLQSFIPAPFYMVGSMKAKPLLNSPSTQAWRCERLAWSSTHPFHSWRLHQTVLWGLLILLRWNALTMQRKRWSCQDLTSHTSLRRDHCYSYENSTDIMIKCKDRCCLQKGSHASLLFIPSRSCMITVICHWSRNWGSFVKSITGPL